MDRKRIFIVMAVFFIMLDIGSAFAKKPRQTMLSEGTRIEVVYSVKKYSLTQDYEIIINNKGDVIVYRHDYYDNLEGKPIIKNGKIPADELQDFKEFIMESDVFGFDNDYVANANAVELGSERIKFTINREVKEIVISAATVPARLRAIIERIEEIKAGIK